MQSQLLLILPMIACINFKVLFLSAPFLSVETIKWVTLLSNLSLNRRLGTSTAIGVFGEILSTGTRLEEDKEEEEDEEGEEEEEEVGAVGGHSTPIELEK